MRLTVKEKRDMLSSTFYYEVTRLTSALEEMKEYSKDHPGFALDSTTCAFLLHIRNLNEFFYGTNPRGDTAHAWHYIPSWKGEKDVDIEKWIRQINCFLQHMSYKRVTKGSERQDYKILFLYNHFKGLVIEFLNELPKEYYSPNLLKLRMILN